jgi:tripartite-type tricarboxylate transporter receptor subunit TctC
MSDSTSPQRRRVLHTLAAATAAAFLPSAYAQQKYPVKTVRIIAPFPAGGAADILARVVAQRLTEQLGQTAIVENRPGAAGAIGSELVAKAPPDGYTLLVGVTASHGINPALQKLSYDAIKDFAPISLLATIPHVLVVHPSIPAKNLQEFIKLAKARPGMTFGSAGAGTPHHLAGEMLGQLTGTKVTHVPYKGSAPAVNDLLGGHIDFMSVEYAAVADNINAGKLRALAIATAKRVPGLNVPTFAEAGLPGFEVTAWYALYAPAATPPDIVNLLSKEIEKALANPDTRARLATLHTTPMASTPAEASAYTKAEIARWGKVVKAAGITFEK